MSAPSPLQALWPVAGVWDRGVSGAARNAVHANVGVASVLPTAAQEIRGRDSSEGVHECAPTFPDTRRSSGPLGFVGMSVPDADPPVRAATVSGEQPAAGRTTRSMTGRRPGAVQTFEPS